MPAEDASPKILDSYHGIYRDLLRESGGRG
jgi:hypothetical protein